MHLLNFVGEGGITVLLFGELPFSVMGSYLSPLCGVTVLFLWSYPSPNQELPYSHCMQLPLSINIFVVELLCS